MDNNSYNNFNSNTDNTANADTDSSAGSGTNTDNSADAANNMANAGSMANADNTNNSSQPETSSTYGYSYVNQEQKNPNSIWRAEENTSNSYTGSAAYGSTQSNGSNAYDHAQSNGNHAYGSTQPNGNTAYGNAQSDSNTAYSSTQSDNSSAYSSIYGNADRQGNWSTYSETKQQKKEARARKRAEKAANANPNFGIKLAKCASLALVFGLVAGTAFEGSSYLMGNALGTNDKETVVTVNEDKEKDVLTTTDSTKKTTPATGVSYGYIPDFSAVVEECMPSIVAITNMSEVQYENWFGQVRNYESESAGSGIIVSEDSDYLYIATNNHVVESATTLTIRFCDDSTASAEVRGTDKSTDLAVVKVKKENIEAETLSAIKIASLGDSDEVKVGSQSIAIGNALGYGQSVTTGAVSALNREVTIRDEATGETFTNELLQTEAAINPGNSGGALLNCNGEVIGINSSKYSDTTVEGMGFAIPSNMAKPIIEDLIVREAVSEDKAAYLGIVGVNVTSTVADTYNMPEGIFITELSKGTAAEQYGLRKGDIITKFDGKTVKSMDSLSNMLTYYAAGTEVDVTVQRAAEGGYQEQVIPVVLGKKNS